MRHQRFPLRRLFLKLKLKWLKLHDRFSMIPQTIKNLQTSHPPLRIDLDHLENNILKFLAIADFLLLQF